VAIASARPAFGRSSFGRPSFAVAWVCLGVAGVSAVAAAAICLPLPHGRSVFAPELRSTIAPELPATDDFDVAQTWREELAQLASLGGLGPRGTQGNSWMPDGGLSTLLATRFPSAGNVRLPGDQVVARLPLPRPDGIAQQDVEPRDVADQEGTHEAVVRNVPVKPQVASLPPQPQPKSGGFNLFDKLFGDPDRAAKAVLAANPNTALYDIARRVVYLPGGERLEAHSGYGKFLDDPQSIERKDVGVTPPNVYAVSFREKPFHGVRALRMKPVGDGNMYGRDGILAHSYLLGEQGASNGCISVRDYEKFLQAYEDGKFNRIIVLRSAEEPVPSQVASAQADGT
jgi:hypothetical protein